MKRIKRLLSIFALLMACFLCMNNTQATELLSGINYLKTLRVGGANFEFKSNIIEYDIVVPYGQDKLAISFTKGHPKQTVEVLGGPELYPGNNSIVVKVTAEDKTVRNYNLTIRRQSDGIEISNDKNQLLSTIKTYAGMHIYLRLNEKELAVTLNNEIVKALKENNKTLNIEWINTKGETVKALVINSSQISNTDSEINPNFSSELTSKKIKKMLANQEYFSINTNNIAIPEGSLYKHKVNADSAYYLVTLNNDQKIQRAQLKLNDGYIILNVDDNEEYAIVTGILNDIIENEINTYSWLYPLLFGIIAALIFGIIGVTMMRNKKFK